MVAYSQPPAHLCMAQDGRSWFRRGTGAYVAEVARALDADVVINLQGDEPLIDPDSLDLLVDLLARERILIPLKATTLTGAATELVRVLVESGATTDPEKLEELVADSLNGTHAA